MLPQSPLPSFLPSHHFNCFVFAYLNLVCVYLNLIFPTQGSPFLRSVFLFIDMLQHCQNKVFFASECFQFWEYGHCLTHTVSQIDWKKIQNLNMYLYLYFVTLPSDRFNCWKTLAQLIDREEDRETAFVGFVSLCSANLAS